LSTVYYSSRFLRLKNDVILSVRKSYCALGLGGFGSIYVPHGAVNKGRLHKIAKSWHSPPLSAKCPHWLNPSSLVRVPCGHTVDLEKSKIFCTQKCGRPQLNNRPLTSTLRMSFVDDPYRKYLLKKVNNFNTNL